MKKLLNISIILVFLLSSCSPSVNNNAIQGSKKNKKSDEKAIVIEKKTAISIDKTEFKLYLRRELKEVKQPISYNNWLHFLIFTKDSDQFESPTINMLSINGLPMGFKRPDTFENFADIFNQATSEDWFYPSHSGDLNYLISKSFYIPLFYTSIHNVYAIAYMSPMVDDNGVYPNIKLFVYDKHGT